MCVGDPEKTPPGVGDPGLHVCSQTDKAKCGAGKCYKQHGGSVRCAPNDKDLYICTETQKATCGKKKCVMTGAGPICRIDTDTPELDVCTTEDKAACGTGQCVGVRKSDKTAVCETVPVRTIPARPCLY